MKHAVVNEDVVIGRPEYTLPSLSLPGLFSTAVLAFLLCWDEFFYPLILTQTSNSQTLPVAINDFIGRNSDASEFGAHGPRAPRAVNFRCHGG